MLERQSRGTTRAEEVAQIEHDLLELYRDPDLAEKPQLLERRGGAFYSEAAAQLVASLASGTGDVQVVNARNAGAIPNLADDDVVEVAARVDTDGAHPIPVAPLGQDMLGLVQHAKAYERLTIEAATTGDRSTRAPGAAREPARPRRRRGHGPARRDPRREPRASAALRDEPLGGGAARAVRIDGTSKGMPRVSTPVPLLEAGAAGLVARTICGRRSRCSERSALEHNVSLMAAYCDEHGVSIAPHGKTTMAPQLWWRQLEAGAWGISAATAAQAR